MRCTVYVAVTQRSYLFLGFPAFLFPCFLRIFPRQEKLWCLCVSSRLCVCVCVPAHPSDSGSYPEKVEVMRTAPVGSDVRLKKAPFNAETSDGTE